MMFFQIPLNIVILAGLGAIPGNPFSPGGKDFGRSPAARKDGEVPGDVTGSLTTSPGWQFAFMIAFWILPASPVAGL